MPCGAMDVTHIQWDRQHERSATVLVYEADPADMGSFIRQHTVPILPLPS